VRHLITEVNYVAEWAFWINSKTLKLMRLLKTIPVGSVVLTKIRGATEEGVKYVETEYGIAEESGVKEISKRDAGKILTRQAFDYMKQNKRWPPNMAIKDSFKDGDVEVQFTPSEYDSFYLKFTSELIGQKPLEFFKKIKSSEKEPEPLWKVEIAKSGRSKCRTCEKIIDAGLFRIGEPYFYEDHLSYRWHHPICIAPMLYTPLEKLDGFKMLKPDEKLRLRKLLQK
jgi:hypothetical protein